jgi:hypothetical protein
MVRSLTFWTAWLMTSSRWCLTLDKEKRKAPFIGDQHKTRRPDGSFFNLLDGLAYDLEPMVPDAGQGKAEGTVYRRPA